MTTAIRAGGEPLVIAIWLTAIKIGSLETVAVAVVVVGT